MTTPKHKTGLSHKEWKSKIKLLIFFFLQQTIRKHFYFVNKKLQRFFLLPKEWKIISFQIIESVDDQIRCKDECNFSKKNVDDRSKLGGLINTSNRPKPWLTNALTMTRYVLSYYNSSTNQLILCRNSTTEQSSSILWNCIKLKHKFFFF